MEKIIKKETKTTTEVYFSEDEICDILVAKSGLKGATCDFDESSGGGIRGARIRSVKTEES